LIVAVELWLVAEITKLLVLLNIPVGSVEAEALDLCWCRLKTEDT
jgi:hypothetical protein